MKLFLGKTKYITICCLVFVAGLIFFVFFSITQERNSEKLNSEELFSVTIVKKENSVMGDNQKVIAEIYYEQPEIAGDSNAARQINEYFETEAKGWINGKQSRLTLYRDGDWDLFHQQLNSMREIWGDDVIAVQPCQYIVETELVFQDEKYISFKHSVKYQTGGPSSTYYFGTTFDKKTGERIPINQIKEVSASDLKSIIVSSYENEEMADKSTLPYESFIELYGDKNQMDYTIMDGEYEIELNYEYYYDGEFFYIILNRGIYHNSGWIIKWNGELNDKYTISDLTLSDFAVSDGIDTITLDTPFNEMILHKEMIEPDDPNNPMNHFVGKIYEEYAYSLYYFLYEDEIDIYVSNLDYDKKDRRSDTYYITQIVIRNTSFMTPRGIKVGSSREDVVSQYGKGDITVNNDVVQYSYYCGDWMLQFTMDEDDRVKTIGLFVKWEDEQSALPERQIYNEDSVEKNILLQFLNDEIPYKTLSANDMYYFSDYCRENDFEPKNILGGSFFITDMNSDGKADYAIMGNVCYDVFCYNEEQQCFEWLYSFVTRSCPVGNGIIATTGMNWCFYEKHGQDGSIVEQHSYFLESEGNNIIDEVEVSDEVWEMRIQEFQQMLVNRPKALEYEALFN